MAYDVRAMLNAVRAVVAATWTDCLGSNDGGGIHLVNQAMRRPLDALIDPTKGGALPFAVVWLGPAEPTSAWGIGNAAKAADLTLFYAGKQELEDQTVWERLNEIERPMYQAIIDGLIIHEAGHDADRTNEIEDFFLTRSVPYSAGSVTFPVAYGESAFS